MAISMSARCAVRCALAMAAVSVAGAAVAAPGEGGSAPMIAASAASASQVIVASGTAATAELAAEMQMRSAFNSWKQADGGQSFGHTIAIPSVRPVDTLRFTSNFGIRSDPFNGSARMHAGVDIPGPVGTPVYATADGTVDRAERAGGYGNLVELDHGKGIQTRYGHLSRILVAPGAHVTRGQLIALMGSTGRSTGPHLHYEVRMDGHAVNPAPFLTTGDYLLAAHSAAASQVPTVLNGPAPQD